MKTYREFTLLDEGRNAKIRAARKAERERNKPGAIVPVRPGGARTEREAVGKMQPVKGPKRPPVARKGLTTMAARRANAIEKYRERSKDTGFRSGFKQGMGFDSFSKDPSTRRKSQKEAGKKTAEIAKKELRKFFTRPKPNEVGVSGAGAITGPRTRSSGGGAR